MRRLPTSLEFAALLIAALIAVPLTHAALLAQVAVRDDMIVSTDQLAEWIGDDALVLIQTGNREEYDAEHIPGAHHLSFSQIAMQDENELILQLRPVDELEEALERIGVSGDSRIVIYPGGNWVTSAARVYLTLDYLGLASRTSILDGGLRAWKAEGRPTTDELPIATDGDFTPQLREKVVAEADWVAANLENRDIAIVDARTANFYGGSRAGMGMPRAGHIPGAGNVPFTSVVEEDLKFKDRAALEELLKSAGAEPGKLVVTYCHIGQQASLVYFVARYLGYDARMYDGSFQEWSNRDDLPVVNPWLGKAPGLITTGELAGMLERGEEVRVIDIRSNLAGYLKAHIPGAAYVHYETLRASRDGVPADILSGESYAALFSRLGISEDRPTVIYADGGQNFNATFLAWLLGGFIHPSVRILDGGYEKWAAENRSTSRAYPEVEVASFSAENFQPNLARIGMVSWVVENAETEGSDAMIIVDVRPPNQYAGEAGAQARRGHIPGAINHPWSSDLVSDGSAKVWKPVDEIRVSYEAQGITADKHVILYCNTGTEASHAYFALHDLLGYPMVDVYVPSWTEWSAREELPVVVGLQASGNQ